MSTISNLEWSGEEKQLLRKLRPVFTTREISSVFRRIGYTRTDEAVDRKSRRLGVKFFHLGFPDVSDLDEDTVEAIQLVFSEREEVRRPELRSTVNKYPQRITKTEEQTAREWIDELVSLRREQPQQQQYEVVNSEGMSLVITLSDIHIGRSFRNLLGDVSYSVDIAEQRCRKYTEEILGIAGRYGNTIDEIVLLLVGDLTDGVDIFPGQTETSEITPLFQIHRATMIIWEMLVSIREALPLVPIRVITCRGNHGRVGSMKISNWDNVVYQELELISTICNNRHNDRIFVSNNFNLEYNTTSVKGWKVMIRHYAPSQADTSAAQKKFGNWHDIHNWDTIVYGHWHHWGVMTWQGRPLFRNGSVMGADPYAEQLAVYDEPAQLVFGITRDRLPEFVTPVSLVL